MPQCTRTPEPEPIRKSSSPFSPRTASIATRALHLFLHDVRQLLDLVRLSDHIQRERVLGRLVHIRLQLIRQAQQPLRIRHQLLLPFCIAQLRLLLFDLWRKRSIRLPRHLRHRYTALTRQRPQPPATRSARRPAPLPPPRSTPPPPPPPRCPGPRPTP